MRNKDTINLKMMSLKDSSVKNDVT